jgi:hypothetical protein
MRARSPMIFVPGLERFERRQLLAAAALGATTQIAAASFAPHRAADPQSVADAAAIKATNQNSTRTGGQHLRPAPAGAYGYLGFRVTNTPWQTPYKLVPPFQQVLVQAAKPVPGKTYNVCFVTVKNGTSQTFTASDGFTVRLNNVPKSFSGFPILTGDEVWKPKQILVFYVLTKKYYPVSFVGGGFQFDTGGRSWTAIPGPAGIFLRLKYNPATFARTLDWIVAYGQGNETGKGAQFGLPNTTINEFVDARTHRQDFAGHF